MIILERTARTTSGSGDQTSSEPNGDGADAYLEFRGKRHPDSSYSVRYRTDDRCAFVRGAGWWLYASTPTGLAIFTALNELLARAPSRPLAAVLDSLEDMRPAAFVAFDEATETLYFGRSLDGFASLYFGSTGERLMIADSALDVAKQLGPVRLSRHDKEVWCARNVLEPEGSFYEGVKRCFAGVRYDAAPHEREPRIARLMAPDARIPKDVDPVRILTDGLRETFAGYGNRKVALRLSGGVDSRVLLVGLMDAVRQGILRKDQILCTSVLFPGLDCDESDVIRPVVELSGFEWVGIEAAKDNIRLAWDKCLHLPAPPFPTSFIGMQCVEAAQQRGAEVMLSGHGGDELFDFNLTDVLGMPLAGRLRRLDLIRYLRQTRTWRDEAKALAVAVLGRRGLRSLHHTLRAYELPGGALNACRLGTRLAVAEGYGYEMSAISVTERGLLTDAPFYRAQFLAQLDPVGEATSRDFRYKANAQRYMTAHAPDIAAAPTRKVAFDAMVSHHFLPERQNRDDVDSTRAPAYASALGYDQWGAGRASTADIGYEDDIRQQRPNAS